VIKRGKKISKRGKPAGGSQANRERRDVPVSDKKPGTRGLGVILGDTPESLVPKPK